MEQEEDDGGEGAHDDVVLQSRVHRVPTNEGRLTFRPVLRIRDIFVWIRIWIRGSMPLTNGSGCGSGSCYFRYSLSFKMPTKNKFFKNSFPAYYFLIRSKKDVTKQKESRFFLLFLLGDRRIRIRSRIRIHTSDYWIRIQIQEAQKHTDPPDPDSDPNPQHWFRL
jgi:hypothetical protein